MKKLGFGLMRLPLRDPDDHKSIDLEQTKQMVDTFLARGFTYFDTAWMYCGFESENAIRKALVERYPRDSYTLATKLHAAFIQTKEDRDRIFLEQCVKTGVDFFDYYLIHDVNEEHYAIYQRLDCFNWLREKKQAGLVKKIGLSFHDTADVLDRVLSEQTGLDFVQLQINYLDWESESVQSRRCYEVARRHGLPVVIMEPVKGGTLANVPPAVRGLFKSNDPDASIPSWAIRFAAGLEGVIMVLSGMSNMEQLLDNTSYMSDFKPLTPEQLDLLPRAVALMRSDSAIPCTACAYCLDGCPQHIAIPRYFSLYNTAQGSDGTAQRAEYATLTDRFGKASDCVGCGQCESVCPQHLPIIEHLRTVAKTLE